MNANNIETFIVDGPFKLTFAHLLGIAYIPFAIAAIVGIAAAILHIRDWWKARQLNRRINARDR